MIISSRKCSSTFFKLVVDTLVVDTLFVWLFIFLMKENYYHVTDGRWLILI
jgi:hypothetical protein